VSVESYEFFGAEEDEQASLLAELRTLLVVPDSVAFDGPRRVRQHWTTGFARAGWACDVPVAASNLTVSYVRRGVGVCTQLGNVARTYADLLKLERLFRDSIIGIAVEVVPTDDLSRRLGSNHASYERLTREVRLFRDVITAPLLVLGVEY
jgi:hypothetical protein